MSHRRRWWSSTLAQMVPRTRLGHSLMVLGNCNSLAARYVQRSIEHQKTWTIMARETDGESSNNWKR